MTDRVLAEAKLQCIDRAIEMGELALCHHEVSDLIASHRLQAVRIQELETALGRALDLAGAPTETR